MFLLQSTWVPRWWFYVLTPITSHLLAPWPPQLQLKSIHPHTSPHPHPHMQSITFKTLVIHSQGSEDLYHKMSTGQLLPYYHVFIQQAMAHIRSADILATHSLIMSTKKKLLHFINTKQALIVLENFVAQEN